MFFIIITIVCVSIFIIYLKHPKTRGKRGENKVRRIIGKTVEGKKYVINDLMLENNGKTCQIDHIVINPRGIFVIETKNYSGEIYGSESQYEWTQVLAYGNVKNKLYNPLKQNATHIYNIKKIVGDLPFRSLVVFTKNNTRHINANNVIPLSSLKSILLYGKNVLSIDEMESTYNLLLINKSNISKHKHINNIRKQQVNLKKGLCPRCNGKLVLRNGRFGEFWGCKNYPKCKFKKSQKDTN